LLAFKAIGVSCTERDQVADGPFVTAAVDGGYDFRHFVSRLERDGPRLFSKRLEVDGYGPESPGAVAGYDVDVLGSRDDVARRAEGK
jgi:hypothetical protein